jgi:hypothetical protein
MRPKHGKPGPSTEGLWTIVTNCLNLCRITTPVPGQLASRVASCLPMIPAVVQRRTQRQSPAHDEAA